MHGREAESLECALEVSSPRAAPRPEAKNALPFIVQTAPGRTPFRVIHPPHPSPPPERSIFDIALTRDVRGSFRVQY